ncbi:hypothetical protein CTAYLR_006013 [Chrysophaeum taylorii]|uniref:MYND-type domain-containing protein n=1 Tax=Chrysophaeum taylorii TaxID=2483200 RepID=A0AAD7U736_9STRA|nr:hypothetical protein CTAYLR_006013 [Chrysophaeum taylorii]
MACSVCARPSKAKCVCGTREYCSKVCQRHDFAAHRTTCARVRYCLRRGTAVFVVGLETAKKYNWRRGVVDKKCDDNRWCVRLSHDKSLLVKAENLRSIHRCASRVCLMPGASVSCESCHASWYCNERCRADDAFRHGPRCVKLDEYGEAPGSIARIEKIFRDQRDRENVRLDGRRVDTYGPDLDRLRFLKEVDACVREFPELAELRSDMRSAIDAMIDFRRCEMDADIKANPMGGGGNDDDEVPCPVCMINRDDAGGLCRGMCFTCGLSICASCAVDVEIASPPVGDQCDDLELYEDECPFARKCPICNAAFMPRCTEREHQERMERLLRNKPNGRHVPFVLMCLGDIFLEGCDGVPPDSAKAAEFYEKAAGVGSLEATIKRGKVAWRDGKPMAAKEWFSKAVDKNYGPARVQLANLYIASNYILGDKETAVSLLKKAFSESKDAAAFDALRRVGVGASDLV